MKARPLIPQFGVAIIITLIGVHGISAMQVVEQSGMAVATETSCQTGHDGRAQLNLGSGGVLRLGADSALTSDAHGAVTLSGGTALFDFSKGGETLNLNQPGKAVSIRGGTGFARYAVDESGKPVLAVECLAGRVKVGVNEHTLRMTSGEVLALNDQGKTAVNEFNLTKLTGSSSLLKDFHSTLPSQPAIQREVKEFASLENRGFIRPVGGLNGTLFAMETPVGIDNGALADGAVSGVIPRQIVASSIASSAGGSSGYTGVSSSLSFTVISIGNGNIFNTANGGIVFVPVP